MRARQPPSFRAQIYLCFAAGLALGCWLYPVQTRRGPHPRMPSISDEQWANIPRLSWDKPAALRKARSPRAEMTGPAEKVLADLAPTRVNALPETCARRIRDASQRDLLHADCEYARWSSAMTGFHAYATPPARREPPDDSHATGSVQVP